MKSCKGCGLELQKENRNKEGFIPSLDKDICLECFKLQNYGELKINKIEKFDEEQKKNLSDIYYKDSFVFLIIDVLNPMDSIVPRINEYVQPERLIIILNKIDLLPKLISEIRIRSWIKRILNKRNIRYKELILVSSLKNINIDYISDFILENKKDVDFIGYSNVGKSTFLKSLFKSHAIEIQNTVSNSIGTTKKTIELKLKDFILTDYPGFIQKGNIQNSLNPQEMKTIRNNKEIKIKNFQLSGKQLINLNFKDVFFVFENEDNIKNGYQFIFSNNLNLTRHNFEKFYEKNYSKFNLIELKDIDRFERSDLIISGLGIIVFKLDYGQRIWVNLPKGTNFDIVESIFDK